MLLDFIVDYSRDPKLRKKFERDSANVFASYEVSPGDQELLGDNDRNAIAARLHQEIDEMLSGGRAWMWSFPTPEILKGPQPSKGPVNKNLKITILAKNLVGKTSVGFYNATDQVTASIESVKKHSDDTFTILCSATFTSQGTYSLTVANFIKGHTYPTLRPDCFTAT